jgi:DNA-binding CsgD family transcriptional regulator
LQDWNSLSQREQDVTALVCLGYTNRQIAALMGVSTETVKTHLSNTLYKLNLLNRRQLRHLFSGWDFSAWQG